MSVTASTSSKQLPHLELRVLTNHVGLYADPPEVISDDQLARGAMTTSRRDPAASPKDYTRLLEGPLDDVLLYSRQENSSWLIDIAHDICDPALKRGSLQVWVEAENTWRVVNPSETLTASTYVYSVQAVVSLSKISGRRGRSETTTSGRASSMANHVKDRDEHQCWVSGARAQLINSHICPKRMGDHIFRVVYSKFVSPTLPPALSINHTLCGITLHLSLDDLFDKYELGLRRVAPDEYECHSFFPPDDLDGSRCTIFGVMPVSIPSGTVPLLHGYMAYPPQPQHASNPPPGLFRWHYLQCVLKRFGHPDYHAIQNIYHFELPLRMKGDSDEEGTDIGDAWPSATLDRGRAMEMVNEDREERQRLVGQWVSTQ